MNTTSFATLGIFHNVRSANIYGGSANTDLNQILQWEKNSQFESVIAGYGQNIAPTDEDLWIDSDTQLWAPANFCFRPKFTWDLREFYFWDLGDHCRTPTTQGLNGKFQKFWFLHQISYLTSESELSGCNWPFTVAWDKKICWVSSTSSPNLSELSEVKFVQI